MPKTILVVEDCRLAMTLVCDLLELERYKTLRADNGNTGLRLALQHHPDLILMDIKLPDVSGTEVTKWIKSDSTLKNTPVIALTAFAMRGDRERFMASDFDGYISKPIDFALFFSTIDRVLAASRLAGPSFPPPSIIPDRKSSFVNR